MKMKKWIMETLIAGILMLGALLSVNISAEAKALTNDGVLKENAIEHSDPGDRIGSADRTVDAPIVATLSGNSKIKTSMICALVGIVIAFIIHMIRNRISDNREREDKQGQKKNSRKTDDQDK